MFLIGFSLAEIDRTCQKEMYQEVVEEKWICYNAVPHILKEFPELIEHEEDVIEKSSHDYPKGCYLEINKDDPTKYVIGFNTPPRNVSDNTTENPLSSSTAQSATEVAKPRTTTNQPDGNANSTNATLHIRQICRLMDRKYS